MTPADFRNALAGLDLTQTGFGRIVGHDGRSVRRWACGETPIPAWVSLLLATWAEFPAAMEWAQEKARGD